MHNQKIIQQIERLVFNRQTQITFFPYRTKMFPQIQFGRAFEVAFEWEIV